MGEELWLPTTSRGWGEGHATGGVVLHTGTRSLEDLIFLRLESGSRQPPRRPRASPCCSAHQVPDLSLQQLRSRTLLPSRSCSQSCPPNFCLPADREPGPPSPGIPHGWADRRWWEQCRPGRRAAGQRHSCCRLQQPWRGSDCCWAMGGGEGCEPQHGAFRPGGVKEQGTEYFRLCNRHRSFRRSSTAGISRSEGNF